MLFKAIDSNNDGYISQREWLKVTSLGTEQSVIPIQRIYEVFRSVNADRDEKGISFAMWMEAVSRINLDNIPNNKPRQVGVADPEEHKSEKKHLQSVHIMTVLRCIDNVWSSLGPAHREAAYQKALMVCCL